MMFIPVLAVVAALLLPVHAPVLDGCDDVYIIGARGSGQAGYGAQVGAVVSETVASIRQTGRTVGARSLDYPAISISEKTLIKGISILWNRSKDLVSSMDFCRPGIKRSTTSASATA